MASWKVMIIHLTVSLIKRIQLQYILHKLSQYFLKPHECSSKNIKVKSNLSNYATKADLKGKTIVDTSN